MEIAIQISYIVAAVLFIYGLKMLASAQTAVQGNWISAIGMLIAIVATMLDKQVLDFKWIAAGIAIGAIIGAVAALKVKMTAMPEMVALFNGAGGLASLLVAWAEYYRGWENYAEIESTEIVPLLATYITVLIGGVTFTGSVVAYAKLAEKISSKPVLFRFQQILNLLLLLVVLAGCVAFMLYTVELPGHASFYMCVVLSLILGVLVTIPIGGADMPVVIALLNSYSGLAACAAGFVIENTVLIVSGSLVGASGIILTSIMCKAMNRSLANVMFSGMGATAGASSGTAHKGEAKVLSPQDAYFVLEAAGSVVFVPGYGMAVAQAQHAVRELGDLLKANGAEVKYAIHPVAGRMPGHMNVLLAEANVPYDELVEMDDINPIIETVDVAIVIGANDVVNPAARTDKGSAIYGMPIINVDHARTCFVLKRSLGSGFAGVDNPLFFAENTRMILGDAKATVTQIIEQFKN